MNFFKTLLARVQRIFLVKFTMDVFARFGRDNGGLLAAGLSFFLVLALVPLLLIGLWGLGLVYAHNPDRAVMQIQDLLATRVLPGAANKEVVRFMMQAHISDGHGHAGPTLMNIINGHGIAGLIGFLGVVWAAIQIFVNGLNGNERCVGNQRKPQLVYIARRRAGPADWSRPAAHFVTRRHGIVYGDFVRPSCPCYSV